MTFCHLLLLTSKLLIVQNDPRITLLLMIYSFLKSDRNLYFYRKMKNEHALTGRPHCDPRMAGIYLSPRPAPHSSRTSSVSGQLFSHFLESTDDLVEILMKCIYSTLEFFAFPYFEAYFDRQDVNLRDLWP